MLPTNDDLKALIQAHFPGYRVETIEVMGHQGWGGDSDAFTVNRRDIFRFPRSRAVREDLAVEVRLLPLLEPVLPLPIPHFTCVVREAGDAGDGLPLFVGYPRIEGLQLTGERCAALAPPVRSHFAREIGGFLGALHAFPVSAARAAGVRVVDDAHDDVSQLFERVRTALFPLLNEEEQRWVQRLFVTVLDDPDTLTLRPVLCHKDLSGDHILFLPGDDPGNAYVEPRLTGIIDFGDRRIMDPMVDFAGLLNEYGEEFCLEALAAAGHQLDEQLQCRLHFYARRTPLFEMLYGVEAGVPSDVEEGRQRLSDVRREAYGVRRVGPHPRPLSQAWERGAT